MSKVHALKTLPEYYKVVGSTKTFEVRKNDRNFQVGDILWLQEWSEEDEFTGQSKKFTVSYILEGGQFGIEKGYCVMGLGPFIPSRNLTKVTLDDIFSGKTHYMTSEEVERIFR